jgi:hypothetical protein
VYFNYNDKIVGELAFTQIDDPEHPVRVPVDDFEAQLINLARKYSTAVIGLLKMQIARLIQESLSKYSRLENEACELSTSDATYEAYIAKLHELCQELRNLTRLDKHSHHQQRERFIQQMIAALEQSHATLPPVIDVSAASATEAPDADIMGEAPSPASEIAVPSPVEVPMQLKLNTDIDKLCAAFKELKEESATFEGLNIDGEDEKEAATLSYILRSIYEISLLCEEGPSPSLQALIKLQKLHSDVCRAGEQLFRRSVVMQKIDALKKLPAFHYLITDKYLPLALQTGKHQLLDYILTHGDFTINDHPVTIRDKTYPSAVHYCVACDTEEKPMSECLSVLIKHGASITAKDERGLPIAYSILSTPAHPLRRALMTPVGKSKTLYSIPFYMQLVAALHHHLATLSPGTAEHLTVQKEIDIYRNEISVLMSYQQLTGMLEAEKLSDKAYVRFYKDKVKRDPELAPLMARITAERDRFLKKLTPEQKRIVGRAYAALMKNTDELADDIDADSMSYDELKCSLHKSFHQQLDLHDKVDSLFDIQKELKGTRNNSKRIKQLQRQNNELVDEINAYKKTRTAQSEQRMQAFRKAMSTNSAHFQECTDVLSKLTTAFARGHQTFGMFSSPRAPAGAGAGAGQSADMLDDIANAFC